MEITSPNSFKTNLSRAIERIGMYNGQMRFSIEDTYEGKAMLLGLDKEECEALITLLSGGDLKVKPKFHKGDIVRFDPHKSKSGLPWMGYVAQQGSLAVVTQDYDGGKYVYVRWICTRSKTQSDGSYSPECFDVITANQLTDYDKQEIINRSLRG